MAGEVRRKLLHLFFRDNRFSKNTLSGGLEKKSEGLFGNFKRYYFICDEKKLTWYKNNLFLEDEGSVAQRSIDLKNIIAVVEVTTSADRSLLERGFRVFSACGRSTLLLRAQSKEDRDGWIEEISKAKSEAGGVMPFARDNEANRKVSALNVITFDVHRKIQKVTSAFKKQRMLGII